LEARKYLANSLRLTASHDESIACYDQVLAADPANSAVASARIFSMQFHDGYDAPRILAEYSRWADRYARPLSQNTPPHPNDPSPDRRLRVGFVSPDFRRHCQALFIEPLFSHHDCRQIELFCYASVSKPDSVTQRLQTHADTWRDCGEMADSALAVQIRDDKIDILIDLTMHMPLGRPLLFARKTAPVQVAYLAYPGTTGMTAIDYRISDPYLDPPGQHDDWYTEQTVRLPETFWCYDPWGMEADRSATAQPLPDPGPLPLQANGYVTFGCLNDFCKMNLPTLALWARVLRAVDRSRLLMLAPKGSTRQKVVQELARHGIEENRLDFVALQPRRKYLAEYQRIDLCLDTLPANGHTTSLDAYWMGCPVVSLLGRTVVGRAGLSQLSNLNLTDLLAHDDDQFVAIAATLAANKDRLADLRKTLRQRMAESPLMNAPAYARNFEAALRTMWMNWCNKGGA
jgi:predicted O-linked N-acetylglucosamine transferase (SPINDLY family)